MWAAGRDTSHAPCGGVERGDRAGTLDLLSVDMVDPSHGWAVGDIDPRGTGGAVWRTTDSGRHWMRLAGLVEVAMSVHFVNQQTGWIAGYAGPIDRTDDGRASWRPQRPERAGEVFNSITTIRSDDAGASWKRVAPVVDETLTALVLMDPHHGAAVGRKGYVQWLQGKE